VRGRDLADNLAAALAIDECMSDKNRCAWPRSHRGDRFERFRTLEADRQKFTRPGSLVSILPGRKRSTQPTRKRSAAELNVGSSTLSDRDVPGSGTSTMWGSDGASASAWRNDCSAASAGQSSRRRTVRVGRR
jgi:hypothetical protein